MENKKMETPTAEQLFKESEDAMRDLVAQSEKKKAAEQNKIIEQFKNRLKLNAQTPKTRKDYNKIFQDARNFAMNMLMECVCLPVEKIAEVFSSPDNIIDPYNETGASHTQFDNHFWVEILRKDNSVIPLPYEMEKPKRRDKRSGKLVEMTFNISRFYKDPEFIKKCNEYYNNFNLQFSTQNDPKNRNKWKLELSVMDGNGTSPYIILDMERVQKNIEQRNKT